MSNKTIIEESNNPIFPDEIGVDEVVEPVVKEKKPRVKKPREGVVTNCNKLIVRKKPDRNSGILSVINEGTTVSINTNGGTNDFYKVTVNGVTGFCMKDYIKTK